MVLPILSSPCRADLTCNIHHLLDKDPASDLWSSACILFKGKITAGTDFMPVCGPLLVCLLAASQ